MAITLGTNITSLLAQRRLAEATGRLSVSFERLSSGSRINSAADDAAGLALADTLRSQARVGAVAIRNANDGISTVAIADSALGEISNVLSRLAELAEQSANGIYSTTQRSALATEFVALGSEIERIAVVTEFNGVRLISGTSALTLQVGLNGASTSQIAFAGVQGTLQALGLATNGSSVLLYSITGATSFDGQTASRLALEAINGAITSLSAARGSLGAVESRLNVAVSTLTATRESLLAAESRIRDVDVASEAAELARLNILQQASAAILAQANQQPSLVLNLLG
jgi:flagellin